MATFFRPNTNMRVDVVVGGSTLRWFSVDLNISFCFEFLNSWQEIARRLSQEFVLRRFMFLAGNISD